MNKKWDVFISHASEDKEDFVKELANKLSNLGVKVWYDGFTLKVGDSLSQKIDEGLIHSNFGIIVISKNFISKNWTDYEFRSLLSKEIGFKKVILPIWHDISFEEVKSFSLFLADKFALKSNNGVDSDLIMKILEVIRPEIYENFTRYLLFQKGLKNAEQKEVLINDMNISPIRHESLPKSQINRIKTIHYGIGQWLIPELQVNITNFKRDLYPDKEIKTWEVMNTTYLEFQSIYKYQDEEMIQEIAELLLLFSFGKAPEETRLPLSEFKVLMNMYKENFVSAN